MSPHGSKLIEWIRAFANRYLSDSTRKRIKRWIQRVRLIPLQVLGLQSEIDSLREELERVKAKLNHLEGQVRLNQDGELILGLGGNHGDAPSSRS